MEQEKEIQPWQAAAELAKLEATEKARQTGLVINPPIEKLIEMAVMIGFHAGAEYTVMVIDARVREAVAEIDNPDAARLSDSVSAFGMVDTGQEEGNRANRSRRRFGSRANADSLYANTGRRTAHYTLV